MIYDKQALRSAGIYAIVNLRTGRMYIGSTTRFVNRWTKHRFHLERNTHHNQALQEDWNALGAGAFEFRILEVTSRFALYEYECNHIHNTPTPYNVLRGRAK